MKYDIVQFREGSVIFSDKTAFYFPQWFSNRLELQLVFYRSDRSISWTSKKILLLLGSKMLIDLSIVVIMISMGIAIGYSYQIAGLLLLCIFAIVLYFARKDIWLEFRLYKCQRAGDLGEAMQLVRNA